MLLNPPRRQKVNEGFRFIWGVNDDRGQFLLKFDQFSLVLFMTSGTGITPKLSTFDASMIVVSLVIGIGIFRTPAIVASHAGSATMFYGAWILGGVISLFGALTFAEIGSRFPRPGAFYQVVAESYHPAAAFMLNWTSVTIVNGAGGAAVAMIGAEYLTPVLFPPEQRTLLATQVTAAGLAAFLIGINALGIKTGAWTQNILTVLKVAMIGVLAVEIGRASCRERVYLRV